MYEPFDHPRLLGITFHYVNRGSNPVPHTLSEEIAHPTVYHHLSQCSVDIQLSGMIKCRENPGVQMQLTQVISHSLGWMVFLNL